MAIHPRSKPLLTIAICLGVGLLAYLLFVKLGSAVNDAGKGIGDGIASMTRQAARFQGLDTSEAARMPVLLNGQPVATIRAQLEVAALDTGMSYMGDQVLRADSAIQAMLGTRASAVGSAIEAAWAVRPAGAIPTGLAAVLVDSGPARLFAGQFTVTPPPDVTGLVASVDSQGHEMHLRPGVVRGRLRGQLWLGQPVVTIPVVD